MPGLRGRRSFGRRFKNGKTSRLASLSWAYDLECLCCTSNEKSPLAGQQRDRISASEWPIRSIQPDQLPMIKLAHALAILICTWAGAAWPHSETAGQLELGHPWAKPARAGGSTQMFLEFAGKTDQGVHFLGVATPIARRAEIRFRSSPNSTATLESLSMIDDEPPDFGSSHLWIELIDLRRDLESGMTFPATLRFSNGLVAEITVLVGAQGEEEILDQGP